MLTKKCRRSEEHDPNQKSKLLTQIPDEIMELILQRLPILGYLSFRQVCRLWRALSKRCLPPPPPQLPWLVHTSYPYYIQEDGFESCLLGCNLHCRNLFYNSSVLASAQGWLIMAARIRENSPVVNFLLNPISGSRVELPPQSTIPFFGSVYVDYIEMAVASFEQTRPEQCLVAGICVNCRLSFCRTIDRSWALVDARDRNNNKVVGF